MLPLHARVRPSVLTAIGGCGALLASIFSSPSSHVVGAPLPAAGTDPIDTNAAALLAEGRETFRHDTFGDEVFWGDTLRLHEAIAGSANGGVGAGVSPLTALAVGLKVDADALDPALLAYILSGAVDLNDPRVTLNLLAADAVVGVKGFFNPAGTITSMGITCALCHSTVDDAVFPGIGSRLDGWANHDLDVGTIVSLAPDVSAFAGLLGVDEATVRVVLQSWGPGRFDAHLLLDGQAFRPDGRNASVLIPSIFSLAGVNLSTYNAWGSVAHWNGLVGNLEMGGQGTFYDPRLADATRFPVAAAAGFDEIRSPNDRVTAKLPALHFFQMAIPTPQAPPGTFDPAAAARGEGVFNAVGCADCHVPPLFTEPGWNAHTPAEIGIDDFQAERGPDGVYRTTPLRALFRREGFGFYHDGRFLTLDSVVTHYDQHFNLGLSAADKSDLVEYLKSL